MEIVAVVVAIGYFVAVSATLWCFRVFRVVERLDKFVEESDMDDRPTLHAICD